MKDEQRKRYSCNRGVSKVGKRGKLSVCALKEFIGCQNVFHVEWFTGKDSITQ